MATKLHEENMKFLVKERSGGVSEITGRPGAVIHHILGRGIPNGFQEAPDMVQQWWPHPPLNCMVLTLAEHEATLKYPRMMKFLLVGRMSWLYGHLIWEDELYREWLNEPPFKEWL